MSNAITCSQNLYSVMKKLVQVSNDPLSIVFHHDYACGLKGVRRAHLWIVYLN